MMDVGGPWCFYRDGIDRLRYIVDKLSDFETMTWNEIKRNRGNHSVELASLSAGAKKRLEDIGRDDEDALFSFRLSGRERVWGIRREALLHLLWWDPKHEVCPSHRKHT